MTKWSLFYKAAYNEDGSLFFPGRLTHEFLESAKKHMGTQYFTNQYLNKVIDEESKPFKKDWLKYYDSIPKHTHKFAYIDPAISQSDSADFTALVVVSCDINQNWYVEQAKRFKITPPEIINLLFSINREYKPLAIGIEDVAFQKALLYMGHEEMLRRNEMIPLTGIRPPTDKTKQMKILGLIPRFEWGRIFIAKGLFDFEQEYLDYAGERSKHDDLMDALSSIEQILKYPTPEPEKIPEVAPNHPDYERYYIQKLTSGRNRDNNDY